MWRPCILVNFGFSAALAACPMQMVFMWNLAFALSALHFVFIILHAPSPAVPTPSVDPTEPVSANALVLCDASAGWITVEHRKKANKHKRKSPKGKEAITADMEATSSICADTVGSPSVIDSALDTAITRPSSCRTNPTLDANSPIDP
ncbi:hypothetical protein D5086_017439 [Populus alba]|uniref:Uncharacterized protein n=1 Tax=Populus alba TaxID=43335 RepID=A0ACC4BXE9_POPAL